MTDQSPMGVAYPAELARIYGPIESELDALNDFLRAEFAAKEPFVHELLVHIAKYRGKQIRPACVFLAAKACGAGESLLNDLVKCAAVVELIHTATLVHDDILDDAKIRRRVETVNLRWGERVGVLLGDYIYSRGFSLSTEVDGVSGLLAQTTHTICEGELLQIGSAFDTELTEERYYEIIRKKTAILYAISCRIGGMLAGASDDELDALEQFGMDLGMAFQIADDALDLVGEEDVVGKSLGTDLKKGKLTLPIIRLRDQIVDTPKHQELMWLLEHPNELGTQTRVHRILDGTSILPEIQQTANQFVASAISNIDRFPPRADREAFEALASFSAIRSL